MAIVIIVLLLGVAVLPFSVRNLVEAKKARIDKRAESLGMEPIFKTEGN